MINKIRSWLGKKSDNSDIEVFRVDDDDVPVEDAGAVATDERPVVRFGMATLAIGFGGFILWAALAPLDQGAPGSGVVIVDSKRKAIQHLKGGIVESIHVRDGARVKAGDLLVRLNDRDIRAQLEIARGQYWAVKATEVRLLAERDNKPKLLFPGDMVEGGKTDTRAAEAMRAQEQLFVARRASLTNELGAMDEQIASLNEQIRGLQSLETGKKKQIELLEKEANALRGLVEEGFVPRNKLYELERSLADLSGSRGNDLASIQSARASIGQIQLRKIQRQQDFRKEIEAGLTDAQRDVGIGLDRLRAFQDEFNNIEIRSPADGYVVGMATNTIGGVIAPGALIMEIVPEDDKLVIDAQLPVNLIDKVQIGNMAVVHFQVVLGGGKQPAIEGKLVQVSADRITDQRSGAPYYSARIEITPKGQEELAENKIVPLAGMQTDVVIVTGERTLLDYLLRPLSSRIVSGMKEL